MQYKINQEPPVTTATVTVPTMTLLITTLPLGLMMTGKTTLEETTVPSTKETLVALLEPFAAPPLVPTFNEQGLIVID